ncbi:MAG: TolC family protein [Bdellovibrionales bacterium]|nr:TolC family protein [Bdellovibrionales bacterium]
MYLLKIITIFLPTVAFGFSYQDAYQMLLTTNPTYTIATVDYEISTLAYQNAKAAQLPRLDLRGGAERFIQENATSGYRAFIGPRLSLPIYQGGQLRAEKRLGSQQVDANELSIQIRLLEQTQQLQEMYARALYSKNYLAVAKNIYERSQKNLRLVEIKYRSGHEYRWVFSNNQKNIRRG